MTRRLLAVPLAAWERDGLKIALIKAGLPTDDIENPQPLFWRFESYQDIPEVSAGWKSTGRTRCCVRW